MEVLSKLSRDIPAEAFDPTTKRGLAWGLMSVFVTAFFLSGIFFFAAITSTLGPFPEDVGWAIHAGIVGFLVGIARVARQVYFGPGWMESARWRLLNVYGVLAVFWLLVATAPAVAVLGAIGYLLGKLVASVGAFVTG